MVVGFNQKGSFDEIITQFLWFCSISDSSKRTPHPVSATFSHEILHSYNLFFKTSLSWPPKDPFYVTNISKIDIRCVQWIYRKFDWTRLLRPQLFLATKSFWTGAFGPNAPFYVINFWEANGFISVQNIEFAILAFLRPLNRCFVTRLQSYQSIYVNRLSIISLTTVSNENTLEKQLK